MSEKIGHMPHELCDFASMQSQLPEIIESLLSERVDFSCDRVKHMQEKQTEVRSTMIKEWELNNLHILTCFFIRLRPCSNSYVACYAPVATRTKTNKKPSR